MVEYDVVVYASCEINNARVVSDVAVYRREGHTGAGARCARGRGRDAGPARLGG